MLLFQEWLIFLYHVTGLLHDRQLLNLSIPVVIRSDSPGSESLVLQMVHLLLLTAVLAFSVLLCSILRTM